jgi:hypothetical protein
VVVRDGASAYGRREPRSSAAGTVRRGASAAGRSAGKDAHHDTGSAGTQISVVAVYLPLAVPTTTDEAEVPWARALIEYTPRAAVIGSVAVPTINLT